jgi:hypothetical protein
MYYRLKPFTKIMIVWDTHMIQTEKEEAETHENAPIENLADDKEIKKRK